MRATKLQHFRDVLVALRDRLAGSVNHVAEAIQEDINPAGNLSGAPRHLADLATESLDADVQVLEAEYGILEDINAAIGRIDAGVFGKCGECGELISEERLAAIPYTPLCIECAQAHDESRQFQFQE